VRAAGQVVPTNEELRAGIRLAIEQMDRELVAMRNALSWLDQAAPTAEEAPPEEKPVRRQKRKKAERQAKKGRAPKKSKAGAKPGRRGGASSKPAAADDEPRTVKGKMPKKGVEQKYCATLPERQAAIAELKDLGYTRVGPGAPLTAGTFDVRPTGDEDDSVVVLWREKAEVAGE
jgi:hypothetical protein